jgi:pimeloyl-ACP methyl ester carboxylesterase
MRNWRIVRNSFIFYLSMFAMVIAAARAFKQPVYWVATLIFWWLYLAVRNAFVFAHPSHRFSFLPADDVEFKKVSFKSRDGLTLSGRFIPSRNHATIILVHGLGSSSSNMTVLARLLAQAGFGVFAIDLRAHGESEGDTSTFGLREGDDVAGAADFLIKRIDVHGDKIGAFGVSLGAQAVLRGALKTDHIRALAFDGLGPSILSDHGGRPKSLVRWLNYPFHWAYYLVYQFMIGGRDKGVLEVIGDLAPRPTLLIAAGEKDMYFSRLFFQAAREPKEILEFPQVLHASGLAQNPKEYMHRLIGFFEKSLHVKDDV